MTPISVAMPYWNRPRELTRSLNAYATVYPDLDLEVVVCDDGSLVTPNLRIGQQPYTKVITLPRKLHALNPCVPINVAVRGCTRDVIVLTNPEIEHREPVLYRMLEALKSPRDYVMTGCRNESDGAWYAGPLTPRAPAGGRAPIPPGTELHFCAVFHRELFERAGGFDEEYRAGHAYDDNDWLFRLYALGDVNFKYVPGVVWHCRSSSVRSLWQAGPLKRNAELFQRKWGRELACAV